MKRSILNNSAFKSGFALVELLIATVIAAIISAALFVAFNQINRYVIVVDDYTDTSLRDATLHQQMEKDLSGIFMPLAAINAGKQEEKKEQAQTPAQPVVPGQPPVPAPPKPPEKPKAKQKPVEKIVYGTNKENNLDVLTFITGNSLQSYWSQQAGKAKPRIARVVYRLQPDKDSKNSYHLTRQEGPDLQFDAYKVGGTKSLREFTMIENIKSLQAEYWQEKKNKDDKENSEDKKKKKEFIKRKEWKVESEKKDKSADAKSSGEKKGDEPQLIPDVVVIKGELWDSSRKYASPFEYKFELNSKASSPDEPAKSAPSQQTPAQKPKGPIDAKDLISRFPENLRNMFDRDTQSQQPSMAMTMNQQSPFMPMQNVQQNQTMYNGQQYVLTGPNK